MPTTTLPFTQVDVFSAAPVRGNPVAVVHDAEHVTEDWMRAFARWTNLSETTFLLPPTVPGADYRLRIFMPTGELPFAGHPTLGSAHAWLARGGKAADPACLVQECQVGLIRIQRNGDALAFCAPPLIKEGEVEEAALKQALRALNIDPTRVVASHWIDNGPGWLGLLLADAHDVLAVRPDYGVMDQLCLGVMGPHTDKESHYEVRAFAPGVGEDPVTGSLHAGFGRWLIPAGLAPQRYTARQGTAIERKGDVLISTDDKGDVWIGGACSTVIRGEVDSQGVLE